MHLRLRICDGAHIATRPPGEQEDRLIPGPPWLSVATFTWLPERNSEQPLPAEQNARREAGLYRAAAGGLLLKIMFIDLLILNPINDNIYSTLNLKDQNRCA